MQILRQKKHPLILEKATLETKEAKNLAKEAKHSAEEEKIILLKTKKDYKENKVKSNWKLNKLRPS